MNKLSNELFKDFLEYERITIDKWILTDDNDDDLKYLLDEYFTYICDERIEELDEYIEVEEYVKLLNQGKINVLHKKEDSLILNLRPICVPSLLTIHDMYSYNKGKSIYEIGEFDLYKIIDKICDVDIKEFRSFIEKFYNF